MRHLLILAGLLLLAFASVTPGQTTDEKGITRSKAEREILRVMDDWIVALKHNDGPALDRMVADDFHIILSDGVTRGKAQELAPVKSGEIRFEHLSAEEVQVFVSGETAI